MVPHSVAVSKELPVSCEEAWALVSDLARMGEWSPENVGGRWLGGASGPALGARFRGRNQNGTKRWSTVVKIVDCEPPRSFEFAVSSKGFKVARWRYDFAPTNDGSVVTESWVDLRLPMVKFIGSRISGTPHDDTDITKNMMATLDRLAVALTT